MKMTSIKVKFRPSTVVGNEGVIYYQIIHDRKVRQLVTDSEFIHLNGIKVVQLWWLHTKVNVDCISVQCVKIFAVI